MNELPLVPAEPAWREYQVATRDFFRSLGMSAHCDVRLAGARTSHDIDVFVEFNHAGLNLRWIVECKQWRRPVSKLHVLALRTIVEDLGADRGLLLSENSFQSGAFEAADHSNVALSTFTDLATSAAEHLLLTRLHQMPIRLAELHHRYWSIPKSEREERGLRQPLYQEGYSGGVTLDVTSEVLLSALAGQFPPGGSKGSSYMHYHPHVIEDLADAVNWIEYVLDDLERRIAQTSHSA